MGLPNLVRNLNFGVLAASLFLLSSLAQAHGLGDKPEDYRALHLSIPQTGSISLPMPGSLVSIKYELAFASALDKKPRVVDWHMDSAEPKYFMRDVLDKILTQTSAPDFESYYTVGSQRFAIHCVSLHTKDRRFLKPGVYGSHVPISIELYLVADDNNCAGPYNPDYPLNGLPEFLWKNAIRITITDWQTMKPDEVVVRYENNEYQANWDQTP